MILGWYRNEWDVIAMVVIVRLALVDWAITIIFLAPDIHLRAARDTISRSPENAESTLKKRVVAGGIDDLAATLGECIAYSHPGVKCGITIVQEGTPAIVVARGPRARALEEFHYSNGHGQSCGTLPGRPRPDPGLEPGASVARLRGGSSGRPMLAIPLKL